MALDLNDEEAIFEEEKKTLDGLVDRHFLCFVLKLHEQMCN